MSIFGTQPPKYTVGATTVTIPKCTMKANWSDLRAIEDESIISQVRHFELIGQHCDFSLIINLFDYNYVVDGMTGKEMFTILYSHFINQVEIDRFYPYSDSGNIKRSDMGDVPFRITDFEPVPFDANDTRICLKVKFKSCLLYDVTKNLKA